MTNFLQYSLEKLLARYSENNTANEILDLFHNLVTSVPPYKELLNEHAKNPATIQSIEDFQSAGECQDCYKSKNMSIFRV